MATKIRLSTSGIVGVTEFVASEVTANITAAGGSAYAVTGAAAVTITLPALDAANNIPRSGDVIYVKNLLDPTVAMGTTTPMLTVDRNGHMIDGETNNITSVTRLESFILIYINPTVGWMCIAIA